MSGVSAAAPRGGPIVAENQRSGHEGWKLRDAEDANPRAGAVDHRIEGYTSAPSIEPGETVEFRVSTNPEERYRIDVYRLGWYDGAGGRLVACLPEDGEDSQGRSQPIPEPHPETELVECDWEVTDTFDVPKQATSGFYLARFVLTAGDDEGESTAHPFVVRERRDRDRASRIVVNVPLSTVQAYNGWGGKSLYDFTSFDDDEANAVSFDRPYAGTPALPTQYTIHLIRFLEAEGYDVSYVTNVDVHRDPGLFQNHELAISTGHNEYASMEEFDAYENARDAGTNLGFFGSNTLYWQVRYEDDERTMIGYKGSAREDPLWGTDRATTTFRNVGRPECALKGVMSVGAGRINFPDYTVQADALDHPWMAGTGFEAGDEIVGVVGHEWAWIHDGCSPPGELTNFFHYEQGTSGLSVHNDRDADAVAYEAPSGATVFSTGTLGFPYRLDPDPTWNVAWPYTKLQEIKPAVLEPDPRLQRFTSNVLNDMHARADD